MKCNMKTMLTGAAGLALAAAIAYFVFPGAQRFISASAPLLIALVCPISMLLMMKTMSGETSAQVSDGHGPNSAPRTLDGQAGKS